MNNPFETYKQLEAEQKQSQQEYLEKLAAADTAVRNERLRLIANLEEGKTYYLPVTVENKYPNRVGVVFGEGQGLVLCPEYLVHLPDETTPQNQQQSEAKYAWCPCEFEDGQVDIDGWKPSGPYELRYANEQFSAKVVVEENRGERTLISLNGLYVLVYTNWLVEV